MATDKAYYESESKKRLLIQKKLCFEEIAGQLQAMITEVLHNVVKSDKIDFAS